MIRKDQLSYFLREATDFNGENLGFTSENLWILWGKVLNFSNVVLSDVLISNFCHLRTFDDLTEVLYLSAKLSYLLSYKKALIKNECRLHIFIRRYVWVAQGKKCEKSFCTQNSSKTFENLGVKIWIDRNILMLRFLFLVVYFTNSSEWMS